MGLRSAELLELTMEDINEEMRILVPDKQSEVKKRWVSFYNGEAEAAFEAFKSHRDHDDERIFQASKPTVNKTFRDLPEESGVKITPQMFRRWFASEIASLGWMPATSMPFAGARRPLYWNNTIWTTRHANSNRSTDEQGECLGALMFDPRVKPTRTVN